MDDPLALQNSGKGSFLCAKAVGRPQDTVQGLRWPPCEVYRAYRWASLFLRRFTCTCVCGRHARLRHLPRAAQAFFAPPLRVCTVAPRQTTWVCPLVGSRVHDLARSGWGFSVHAGGWAGASGSMRGFRTSDALPASSRYVQVSERVLAASAGVRAAVVTHCEPLNNYHAPS